MISAMEQRVRHYWTLRSHDFGQCEKMSLKMKWGKNGSVR